MPDLRTPIVLEWLHVMRPHEAPAVWPPPIRPIEASPQAETLLVQFGQCLDTEAARSPANLSAQLETEGAIEELQHMIAQLGAARSMRIMHWLREGGVTGGLAIGNAIMEGRTQAARAIRTCITTTSRQATLSRMISQGRLDELASAGEAAGKGGAQ